MKREKRVSRRERKAQDPTRALRAMQKTSQAKPGGHNHDHKHVHIHCIACGKHLDTDTFGEPNGADFLRCEHGSDFPHCVKCLPKAKELVEEHDRNEQPVKKAEAWH